MSLAAAELPKPAVVSFDDDAWEDLLNFIEEKQVIPIIGPELLVVQTEAGPENQKCEVRALRQKVEIEQREEAFHGAHSDVGIGVRNCRDWP